MKKRVDLPVLASLNGATPGGWTSYAKRLEEAGADGLELNLYDVREAGGRDPFLDEVRKLVHDVGLVLVTATPIA